MTDPITTASWSYAEAFVAEDDILSRARERAEEVGVVAIGPGGGAALRFLASVLDARAVVEVGTGTGVSGLWLLRGMRSDGVLTTVDIETEHQRLARETFNDAGVPPQRDHDGLAPAPQRQVGTVRRDPGPARHHQRLELVGTGW